MVSYRWRLCFSMMRPMGAPGRSIPLSLKSSAHWAYSQIWRRKVNFFQELHRFCLWEELSERKLEAVAVFVPRCVDVRGLEVEVWIRGTVPSERCCLSMTTEGGGLCTGPSAGGDSEMVPTPFCLCYHHFIVPRLRDKTSRAYTAGDCREHSFCMLGLFRHFSVLCFTRIHFLLPGLTMTRHGVTVSHYIIWSKSSGC